MKKYIAVFLSVILAAGCLSGCGGNGGSAPGSAGSAEKDTEKKLRIVTTIFPEYDWVKEILGDEAGDADITLLLDDGVDIHSYQPAAEDILKIAGCDLFVYVGGESDEWVKDALREAGNDRMEVISLMEKLGDSVREEEVVEGMEAEHEEEGEGQRRDEGPEYDEHVWLSLKNASVLCSSIAEALGRIRPESAEKYRSNAKSYREKLEALDSAYRETVDSAGRKTLLFGDRFPFRYLTDDYGISYYAAFTGCSAESEASFETIAFLAEKTDELGLKYVMTIEKSDCRIAETIIGNTKAKDQKILALDSMQSAVSENASAGPTYLSAMEKNLSVLKEALS